MDSRYGLDYIVEDKEYTSKLASALDTNNITIKKQVFELLSALCVYNADGYTRALDALEHYKILKGERYRFKVVINELKEAQTLEYKTALVAFVNCIIISTPQLKERIRIRNEFIGLKVLDVINKLRQDAANDSDLAVQIDVFEEQRETDETQISGPAGIDLSSHVDVFYAILRQVVETPQEIPFLSVLQHLLRIDPKEAVSDVIWDTAERLLHRASLMEDASDSAKLLRAPSHKSLTKLKVGEGRCLCSCHRDDPKSRKHSLNLNLASAESLRSPPVLSPSDGTAPPIPPPPPPPAGAPPPPPPPPPPGGAPPPPPPPPQNIHGPPPPPPPPGKNKQGPPPPGTNGTPTTTKTDPEVEKLRLPQMTIPRPRSKMKTFNWNKIPNTKVVGKRNIWSQLAKTHEGSPVETLDWDELEGLFCQQPTPSATASPATNRASKDVADIDRKKKESNEITLLDGKRSLNVNIFLKQFRVSNEEIMEMIKKGEHGDIGAEKLRGLLKLLPENDEMEILRSYNGDRSRLGTAEKFILMLMDVPHYKMRIEALLLKEEFETTMEQIEPSINAVIYTARDLVTNEKFHEVLYMVLVAGNFLNNGGYAGDAAGMKLSSLQKLTDIRANKPGMNMLHYVVLQAQKKNPNLLQFPDEMSCLEEATKTTIEQLRNEMNQLDTRIAKLSSQLKNPKCPAEIHKQMGDFLQIASADLVSLKEGLEEVEKVRREVADYFCEDSSSFRIEECFKFIYTFCNRLRQAISENERRRQQEEQAEIRRRNREENAVKRRSSSQGGTQPRPGSYSGSESEVNIMDHLLSDIRSGFTNRKYSEMALTKNKKGKKLENFQNGGVTSEDEPSLCNSPRITRRRMGSFSTPTATQAETASLHDNSPDVTPNGSLRRRRSRVPSEEDDHKLMDYLHTSGHDGSRERKSLSVDGYGSLDRSLARRSRGGGRNRSSLLASEADRQRPGSPSTLSTNSAIGASATGSTSPQPPDHNRASKNWRQKIESWFQENDKEEKNSELKRRLKEHRKSLDLETSSHDDVGGSFGSPTVGTPALDTLPEDRASDVKQKQGSGYRRVYHDWKPSVEKTDVLGAMEAIEEAQSPLPGKEKDKSPWRKSNLNVSNSSEATSGDPSSSSLSARRIRRNKSRTTMESGHVTDESQVNSDNDPQSRRSSFIQDLGQADKNDTLRLYIRRPSSEELCGDYAKDEDIKKHAEVYQSPISLDKTQNKNTHSLNEHNRRSDSDDSKMGIKSQQFLQKLKQPAAVSAAVLKSIEEVDKNVKANVSKPEKRQKKTYQRTMTPSTLRNALQEKLKNSMDTSNLAGTIKSLDEDAREKLIEDIDDEEVVLPEGQNQYGDGRHEQKNLPPSIPKHMRRLSREEEQADNVDIDAENIETPPVTRKTYGLKTTEAPNESSNWSTASTPLSEDDFIGRRNMRRYKSLTNESQHSTADNKGLRRSKYGVDSSENEGNGSELDDKLSNRRSMRFKRLADLAKDCDSETEQMLARQKQKVGTEVDEDLGDGNFNRFSSVRKTLRHKRGSDSKAGEERVDTAERIMSRNTPERAGVSMEKPTPQNIRQSSEQQTDKKICSVNRPEDDKSHNDELRKYKSESNSTTESWKDKISRKFKNADKYDIQKAFTDDKAIDDDILKVPASERLQRKRQDSLARGSDTRGSFRSLSSASSDLRKDKRDRNRSAIDSTQLKMAIDRSKKSTEVLKRDSPVAQRPLSKDKVSSVRRNEPLNRSIRERYRTGNKYFNSSKDDRDEGFEDTVSVKSETNSQGNSSNSGDLPDSLNDKAIADKTISSTMPSLQNNDSAENILKDSNRRVDKSSSIGSLRSSRSSLASATSVNTVRPARPISNSASNTSIVSNKSDVKSPLRNSFSLFHGYSKENGNDYGSRFDKTGSSPASPNREALQIIPGDKTYSNSSLRSSAGVTTSRPISRTDSQKSVGSLSKQSSDGSLRRSTRTQSTTVASKTQSPVKKAQTPNRLSTSMTTRNRMLATEIVKNPSTPNAGGIGTKVRRGESGSGSFKENLTRTSSGSSGTSSKVTVGRLSGTKDNRAPLIDRSASMRATRLDNDGNLAKRKAIGNAPTKHGLPAFMRPTTSSSSKTLLNSEPIKKVKVESRNISLQATRSPFK